MTYVIPTFRDEYLFLSNFYESPVVFQTPEKMLSFRTAEHAFQASKYKAMVSDDRTDLKQFVEAALAAPTANKAKYLGRSVKIDAQKWEQIKIDCMREVVFQKFNNSEMRAKLLSTDCAMLVEGNDWGDTFWGRVNGKGYNMLGVILMECRGFWQWGAREGLPTWIV